MRRRWMLLFAAAVLAGGAVVVWSLSAPKPSSAVWVNLTVAALQAAAAYDIYGEHVIIEYTHSGWRRPAVVLRPERPGAREPEGKMPRARRWQIRAIAARASSGQAPEITVQNAPRLAPPEQEKEAQGKAVAVAAGGLLHAPRVPKGPPTSYRIDNVSPDEEGYWVGFTRLPAVPGGNPSVLVSRDLKLLRVMPGA